MKFYSNSLEETKKIAKKLLVLCKSKFILLNGEIGSGKTTLVKYIAEELGTTDIVNSPTFVIMKVYKEFVHIDAYRINGNLEEYEDFFDEKLVIIEWSNNLILDLKNYLKINVFIENGKHIYEVLENV